MCFYQRRWLILSCPASVFNCSCVFDSVSVSHSPCMNNASKKMSRRYKISRFDYAKICFFRAHPPVCSNRSMLIFIMDQFLWSESIWCITHLWASVSSITNWKFLENFVVKNFFSWGLISADAICLHLIWMCGRWTLPHNFIHREKINGSSLFSPSIIRSCY